MGAVALSGSVTTRPFWQGADYCCFILKKGRSVIQNVSLN